MCCDCIGTASSSDYEQAARQRVVAKPEAVSRVTGMKQDGTGMAQVWIDVEDNENCGYFPMQTFEMRGSPEIGASVIVDDLPGSKGPQEIVGWCSDGDGSPSEVTVVLVGDSGAGESRLINGGDNGVRIRSAQSREPWSLNAEHQRGEPYILLVSDADYRLNL
jgi:hypothetical protein